MDEKLKKSIANHIRLNEKQDSYPYKDSKGNLTIGSGFLVNDEKTFAAQQLQITDPVTGKTRFATEEEKKAEFKRVKPLSDKVLRSTGKGKLFLPSSEDDSFLYNKVEDHSNGVIKEIGQDVWDKLSDGQKAVLVDIHYANNSLDGFPKLKEAVARGDAKAMAEQADFHSGEIMKRDPKTGKPKGTGFHYRNFDRLRRNYAAMSGIDPESFDAYYAIADKYRNHPKLLDEYRDYLSRKRPESQSPAGKGGTGSTLLTGGGADEAFKAFLLSEEERQDLRMRKLYPTMYSEQE